ncbi:ABC transporter permease [Gordonia mangrovi]|uniref:ABC transporter permease n=1 Tax=Gordonia mangrovi TaxID=2665643 RepID=UPI001F35A1EF|nr:ABC transporter permease [Gordonia mangrovi]UVF77022.1 ABC transporter permease [Gordonia mangrovi]
MTATSAVPPVGTGPRAAAASRHLTRVGILLRLGLRRERIVVPVIIAVFVLITLATAQAISGMYATPQQRLGLQSGPGANPAFRFLLGDLDHIEPSAALVSWRVGLFLIAALGVCAAMMTVRQTRREEELGRSELVRAGAVGSLAPVAAAACVAVFFTVIVAGSMSLILIPMGASAGDVVAVFAQYAGTGLAATAVALVAAQVATTAHIANLTACSVVLLGFLVRGVADSTQGWDWLRWTNPVGWAEQVDPFGANNLVPALMSVAVFVVGAGAAGWVAARRDLGAGLLAARPGPATTARLSSIEAFAVRASGPLLMSWVTGVFAYALVIGFMQPSVEQLTQGNEQFDRIMRAVLGDATLSTVFGITMLGFLAVAAGAWGVNLTERLRAEETAGRTEMVLVTPTSRSRYFLAHAGVATAGGVVLMAVAAIGMVLGCGFAGGGWAIPAAHAAQSAAAQVPAVLVVITLALALYAIRPVFVHVGWIVVAGALLLGPLAGMFDMPQWVSDLSPYTHTPLVPVDPMRPTPVLVMLCVAAALLTTGLVSFRRRRIG